MAFSRPNETDGGSQRGPADAFRHCPRCGREGLEHRDGRAVTCGHCGFLYFFNCAAAAGAFVLHRDRLVLCVRAKPPGEGLLDVPGGFIEFGETLEAGLRREIFEELHIETENFRYLTSAPNDYLYAEVLYKTMDVFFICEAPDLSGIRAADDVADYRLVPADGLDPDHLAFPSTRLAYAEFRARPLR